MKKYLSVFKISLQQEFAYRINFIMWRFRNVMQIFLVFFLWDAVFSDPGKTLFGYDRAKILTYVFGLLIVKAFVFSARAVDVAGEVSRGDITNYLLKPVNYFKYWLTRDFSSKALNLLFAFFEAVCLYFILKPPFFLQTNPLFLAGLLISIILAILTFFILIFITSAVSFWYPEVAWGAQFLVIAIITEFLSGGVFPIDILPANIQSFLSYTPFPYLIFFPIQVYLGKISQTEVFRGILISFFWAITLWFLMNRIWQKGLKIYQSQGR